MKHLQKKGLGWPILAASLFLAVILDRATKWLIVRNFSYGDSAQVIPGFHITPTINSGAAFSILSGKNQFLIILSLLVIIFIVYTYLKLPRSNLTSVAVGLILGGALSNFLDRLLYGGIIDFIDFRVFPIFNAADSCISIGVFMLLWYYVDEDLLKTKSGVKKA